MHGCAHVLAVAVLANGWLPEAYSLWLSLLLPHNTAPQKKAPEYFEALKSNPRAACSVRGRAVVVLLVYGRRIAASLEHGSKVTPCQRKLAL